jgi:hypothetical protein
MSATVSGSKTVSTDINPAHTGAALTTILAVAPENMTVKQFQFIADCLACRAGGEDPSTVIGSLFS